MATSFKREHKMHTTEPSDDEVGHGMKKGGHAHKKHMATGGALPMAMARRSMGRPMAAAIPVMRKKGGKIHKAEGGKIKEEERHEEHEMHKIEKEIKHHEHMKAGKAHHGLKKGGMAKPTPGALLGGVEDFKAHSKGTSGTIEGPGYKRGGKLHKAKGGSVASEANTKVVGAKQTKSISSKTGALEGVGYKKGGHLKKYAKGGSVVPYEETEMHGGPKMPTKKAGTGEVKQAPAGYKHGGHVAHKAEGGHMRMHELAGKFASGHEKIDHHPMKHGGKVAHKKSGGKCNY
jgi:hypothetical protein